MRAHLLLAAASVAFAAAVVPARPVQAEPFEFIASKKSPAQPRVIFAPRTGLSTAALVISFAAGSADDGETPGLTRLSQHLLLEANRRVGYQELVRQVYAAGATLRQFTDLRECRFVLEGPSSPEFTRLAISLIKATLHPDIDWQRLGPSIERTLQDAHEPDAESGYIRFLAPFFAGDWRFQNNPFGDRNTLEALERDEIRRHMNASLSAGNATVIVAGQFDRRALASALDSVRGGYPVSQKRPPYNLPVENDYFAPFELTMLGYAVSLPDTASRAALRVLAASMQDGVFTELRGSGAAYGFTAVPLHVNWLDAILLVLPAAHVASSATNHVEFLKDRLAAAGAGKLERATFERNRSHVLHQLEQIDARPRELAEALARVSGDLDWVGPEMAKALSMMTYESFTSFASRAVEPSRFFSFHFGPPR